MSLESSYDPRHLEAAKTIFAALNAYALTPQGRFLLAQCNINGVVVRGSALAAFPDRNPIFKRSINDVDLRTYSQDPGYRIAGIPSLLKFFRHALQHTGFNFSIIARNNGKYLSEQLRARIYPRIEITATSIANPAFKTELHLSLYGAVPDVAPPLPQQDFVKAQNPYLQLAEKIRIMHATSRVKVKPTISAQKNRRVLDLLDIYQAYHVALAHAGSHAGVVTELKKIFGGPRFSQFNLRTKLSIAQHLFVNYTLYSDIKHFDETHEIKTHIGKVVARMTLSGMIEVYKPIHANTVLEVAEQMANLMPLPISRALVRLSRPKLMKGRRIKKLDRKP